MATATAMYHSGRNPLTRVRRWMRDKQEEHVEIVRGEKQRRLHKAFLRYHDPNNWPLLRQALKDMGRSDLIGNGKQHLIPTFQPLTDGSYKSARRSNSTTNVEAKSFTRAGAPGVKTYAAKTAKPRNASAPAPGKILTQHTGLPPRAGVTGAKSKSPSKRRP